MEKRESGEVTINKYIKEVQSLMSKGILILGDVDPSYHLSPTRALKDYLKWKEEFPKLKDWDSGIADQEVLLNIDMLCGTDWNRRLDIIIGPSFLSEFKIKSKKEKKYLLEKVRSECYGKITGLKRILIRLYKLSKQEARKNRSSKVKP